MNDDNIIEMVQDENGVFVEDKSTRKKHQNKKLQYLKKVRRGTLIYPMNTQSPVVEEFLEGFDIGAAMMERLQNFIREL
jgi:hypothetical protein